MKEGTRVRTTKEYSELCENRPPLRGVIDTVIERTNNTPLIVFDIGNGKVKSLDRSWLEYDSCCSRRWFKKCCCCC